MQSYIHDIKKAVKVTLALFLLCGVGYPLLMTGLAQVIFPHQAQGSLVIIEGKVIGSALIGQDFREDYFMKCRPSGVNYNTYSEIELENGSYNGVGSGSQNFAPSNPKLLERIQQDMAKFLENNPTIQKAEIPTDILTASGSGLDPHISPKAATIQLESIAGASGIAVERLTEIVDENTEGKALGIFGEERVNVLKVNLAIAKEMGLLS